jgi:hypothetical protein
MNDSVKALEQFFNDIISQVIPGSALLLALGYIFDLKFPKETSLIILFFAFSYAAGHIVLSMDDALRKISGKLLSNSSSAGNPTTESKSSEQFCAVMSKKYNFTDITALNANEKRSFAMSFDKEASDLAKRFMFLHLSCRTTVFLLLTSTPFLIAKIFHSHYDAIANDYGSFFYILTFQIFITLCIVFFVIYPLEKRSLSFKKRADEAPFTVALAKLVKEKE